MTIYRYDSGTNYEIGINEFKRTLDALSTKIWKDNGCPLNDNAHEFYGYTPSKYNQIKPNCKHPAAYVQYILTVYHEKNECFVENSTSSAWLIGFDSSKEMNEFLESIGIKQEPKKKKMKTNSKEDNWPLYIENLPMLNSHDFRFNANVAIDRARDAKKRIPYDEIGKAICKKINGQSYKYIAKFFMDL